MLKHRHGKILIIFSSDNLKCGLHVDTDVGERVILNGIPGLIWSRIWTSARLL
jgi:hypothetical protein